MSVRTTLPSTTIRFGGTDLSVCVTQADMPESENSVRRETFEKFEADAYRVYSADMQRSDLFRYGYRIKSYAGGRYTVVYLFQSLAVGAGNRLELDACQLSQLRAANRIVAIDRKDDDVRDHGDVPRHIKHRVRGSGNARKVAVKADGSGLCCGDGPVPPTLFSSEIAVPHLSDQELVLSVGSRQVRAVLTFSSHCWNEESDPEAVPRKPAIIEEHGVVRTFSAERYRLSRGLPDMFRKLLFRRVYETGKYDNLGLYEAKSSASKAYTAFFSLRRPVPEEDDDRVRIFVRSAYVQNRPISARGIDIARLLESARSQLHCNDDRETRPEVRPDATA